jgi:hypothetical protein
MLMAFELHQTWEIFVTVTVITFLQLDESHVVVNEANGNVHKRRFCKWQSKRLKIQNQQLRNQNDCGLAV